MDERMNDGLENNQELPEPEIIKDTRKKLDRIEYIMIGLRAILIVTYFILSIVTPLEYGEEGGKLVLEIIVIFVLFLIIENGHRMVAVLPFFGGIKILSEGMQNFSCDTFLYAIMSGYCILVGIYQIISMAYIAFSPKIAFYCDYICANKSNKN